MFLSFLSFLSLLSISRTDFKDAKEYVAELTSALFTNFDPKTPKGGN